MRYGMLAVAVVFVGGVAAGREGPAAPPPQGKKGTADPTEAAKTAVARFYQNIADGKGKENEAAFASPDAAVSGVAHVRDPKSWQKKPAEYLRQYGDKPQYLQVDSTQVDPVHDGLSVARVTYRAGGIKGYAVLTLKAVGGKWKVASLYEETHFVW